MSNLKSYKNLCDWAIRAYADEPTLPEQKDRTLNAINKKLGTKYERKHIDNWLSERAATPKRVRALWLDELIEVEVEYDNGELGVQLRRLAKN